jgi:hypothetical protein
MDKHLSVRRGRQSGDDTRPGGGILDSHGGGTIAHRVTVSIADIVQAKIAAARIPQIRAIVDRLCSDTVEGGMTVSIMYGSDTINLQTSEQRIIDNVWPRFVRAVMQDLLTLGYVIIGRSKTDGTPFVIPAEKVNLVFVDSITQPRQYWVEKHGSADALPFNTTSGKTNRRVEALVFTKNPPDSNGKLTSPVYVASQYAHKIDEALANQASADWVRAHLPHMYEPDLDRMKPPDPSESDQVLPGEIDAAWKSWHQRIVDQIRSNMESMRHATSQLSTAVPAAVSPISVLGNPLIPEDVARAPPGSRYICLPAGIRLAQPVVPPQNALFQAYIDYCQTQIASSFKIPLAELDAMPGSTRYSAPVEESHRRYMRTIETIQRELEMLIRETWMWSNEVTLDQYCAAMLERFAELRKESLEQVNAYLASRTKGGSYKRTQKAGAKKGAASSAKRKDDDNDSTVEVDDDEEIDEDVGEEPARAQRSSSSSQPKKPAAAAENPMDELNAIENVPTLEKESSDAATLKLGETPENLERAKRILGTDPRSIIDATKQRFKVHVVIKSPPPFGLDDLIRVYQLGVMGTDQFVVHAAAVLGINEKSMLLSQTQRLEEAEQQAKVTEAKMGGPLEAAAAAGQAKRTQPPVSKQPNNSSSSSSKMNNK